MGHPTVYHQLGRFIVMFQNLEAAVNELIYLITDVADDPAIAGLPFTKRLDAAVVAQSRPAGTSVARVAREHGVNANQVFAWRKRFSDVQPGGPTDACTFLPVALAAAPAAPASIIRPSSTPPAVIELTVGQAQLRLEGAVDMAVLTLVLQRLLQ